MHGRQQIREAIAELVGGIAAIGGRVYKNRRFNTQDADLPCLLVYSLREQVRYLDADRAHMRELQIAVEARASGPDADDDVDTLAEGVEAAIAAEITLGGLAFDVVLAETVIGLAPEGQGDYAAAILRYTVSYQTNEGVPGAPL